MVPKGTFPDLRPKVGTFTPVKVDLTVIEVEPPSEGRFVKFECSSSYGGACALHFVGVVQLSGLQSTPEPQGTYV